MCALILVAALGISPSSGVSAALAALHEAGLRRDVAALAALYAPDYFHTNADGSVMTRDAVLASYRAAPKTTFQSEEPDEERLVARDRFAVVNERLRLHGKTAEGRPFTSRYRVTYVFELEGGKWRCVNSHASLLGVGEE